MSFLKNHNMLKYVQVDCMKMNDITDDLHIYSRKYIVNVHKKLI